MTAIVPLFFPCCKSNKLLAKHKYVLGSDKKNAKLVHYTGIPRFTLLMWGHITKTAESDYRINRGYLVCSTKGEENRIKSKIAEIKTTEIEECL